MPANEAYVQALAARWGNTVVEVGNTLEAHSWLILMRFEGDTGILHSRDPVSGPSTIPLGECWITIDGAKDSLGRTPFTAKWSSQGAIGHAQCFYKDLDAYLARQKAQKREVRITNELRTVRNRPDHTSFGVFAPIAARLPMLILK